jgi:hypothetical protein
MSQFLPDTLEFLTLLGFNISIDFDENLRIEPPRDCSATKIAELLAAEFAAPLAQQVVWRAQRERKQYLGGPFNGQQHGESNGFTPCLAARVRRGHWAAYFLVDDGRAFFMGLATSERKAKLLAWERGEPKYGDMCAAVRLGREYLSRGGVADDEPDQTFESSDEED